MNKNSLLTRGFTLIELLVVIAIIGILAAVVIGSLNDARSGGQDASIKQSVANIRSQAELIYNGGGYSYLTVCDDARTVNLINASLKVINGTPIAAADINAAAGGGSNGATPASRHAGCNDSDVSYAVVSPLANGTTFWCVDSTGYSGSSTKLANATDYTCNP